MYFPAWCVLRYVLFGYLLLVGTVIYRFEKAVIWYEPLEGTFVRGKNMFLVEGICKDTCRFGKPYLFVVRLKDGFRVKMPVRAYDIEDYHTITKTIIDRTGYRTKRRI
jgi:hypothetical protein